MTTDTTRRTLKAKSVTHFVEIHWHTSKHQYVATLYRRTGEYRGEHPNRAEILEYIRSTFADSVDQAFRDLDAGEMEIVPDDN